jgi:hypothetical protein
MRLDVPLDGSMMAMERRVDTRHNLGRILQRAIDFLGQHQTAKVVVVVDTHCLDESGLFVWGGGLKAGDLQACCMEDVCIAQILSIVLAILHARRSSRLAFPYRSASSCALPVGRALAATRRALTTTTKGAPTTARGPLTTRPLTTTTSPSC